MNADDNIEEPAPAPAPDLQPTFQGRLQLTDFMYTQSGSTSPVRRSPRLNQPLLSRPSTTPNPPSPPKPKSTKRKFPHPFTSSPTTTTTTTATSPQKRPKRAPTTTTTSIPPPSSTSLPLLPDALAPNLLILFIGLNPGLETSRSGHAYAHPSNLFWKLLASSGITPYPAPCRASEYRSLPDRLSLGFTNIVARPTRSGADLGKAELDAGVAVLEAKCRDCRPEVVCVVGKSIWESVWRVRRGRAIRKEEFAYGWQREGENMGVIEGDAGGEEGWKGARVFVACSTSGLAATLKPAEKERIWKELGDWCVQRRGERKQRVKELSEEEEHGEAEDGLKQEDA